MASNPTASMTRAQRIVRGKRSGVVVDSSKVPRDKESGLEDADAMFDAAMNTVEEEKKESASVEKKMKTPRNTRLSLAGQEDTSEKSTASTERRTTRYLSRLRGADKSTGGSPSELSRVSTAPPTPATDDFLTQDDVELPVASLSQRDSSEGVLPIDSPGFPSTEDQEDEGDDLAPPPPPDDSFDEDQLVDAAEPEGLEAPETEPSGEAPLSDMESDTEGDAFNMVHDPETPQVVREERARKEKERIEKRNKKKRKSDASGQGDEVTPLRKSKKKGRLRVYSGCRSR